KRDVSSDVCSSDLGHDGAAVEHAHRQERFAHGDRPRRPLFGAGPGERSDDGEGGPHLRLPALSDHARVPDPALRPDQGTRQGLLPADGDAGFDLDFGDDESGLFLKYLRRGSGYYIDVGAAELVADGKVRLAKGQVDHLTEDAVVLDDGTELPADLVVYATGYGSMNGWV